MSDAINEDVQKLLDAVCAQQKLLRDRGLVQVKSALPSLSLAARESLLVGLLNIIEASESPWESKHGCLETLQVLVSAASGLCSKSDFERHWPRIRTVAQNLLLDPEARVRLSAGGLLGALCTQDMGETYSLSKELVMGLVRSNLERQLLEPDDLAEAGFDGRHEVTVDQLRLKLANAAAREQQVSGSCDPKQIFHDTAGWRNLESSLNALQEMIKGSGPQFGALCDEELVCLILATLQHANRFVRETGYGVCAELVAAGFSDELGDSPLRGQSNLVVQHLALGLADNWSQVRLAASVASRRFLTSLSPAARHPAYPALLPRICLNRYYVAEGVRLYSQETWRQVTGTEGKALVMQYIDHVVTYYIEATRADNHAVREAACACIAELATKLPGAGVRPHVPPLLAALLLCFSDDSWPVRDAACVACGHFIQSFPEDASPSMPQLYPLFFGNLEDSIPSVRQGAAVALGYVVQAYAADALVHIVPVLQQRLRGVEQQSSETERYAALDASPATYGVVKQRRDNDIDLHENRQMYSCGSLAPKMGRGGGGCSDCRFRRPPQPWEGADGAVWLLGELAIVGGHHGHLTVIELLPEVSESCRFKHYTQHMTLFETLCKNLPRICKGLGKKTFKSHLHLFIDHIFYALECDNSLTSSAASQCLTSLSADIGTSVFRARIDEHNPSYLRALDANSYSSPL